jgi:hypothetical protein
MPIGAGTWGAGVVLPAQIFFSRTWSLTLDPEVDAEPNEDGSGRHLAYAMVANLRWTPPPPTRPARTARWTSPPMPD